MAWGSKSRHECGCDSAWGKVRNEVMKRDRAACARSVGVPAALHWPHAGDHIVSKAKTTLHRARVKMDDRSNLEAICKPCHEVKTEAEQGKAEAVRKTLARTVGQREVREDTLLLLSTHCGRSCVS